MILADKIMNERKKNGWSQEELAEQLSVSRQSVSKWESAQAVPDLQKIVAMAEIFGVSTDYLLKDEMEPNDAPVSITNGIESVNLVESRRVTIEEANDFLEVSKSNAPRIANGVSLCVLSPAVLIFLAGLSEAKIYGITETVATAIGLIILLVLVAAAVYTFVVCGSKVKKYEFLEKEQIETAYGVDGMVQEKMKAMESRKTSATAIGVILCIICAIPLIITACLNMAEYVVVAMVSILLIIVSVAVNLFVRTGIVWSSYEKLLQMGEYSVSNKRINKKIEPISGIYWAVVLAGYLGWSFITNRWEFTWIVWPVAGILFGAVSQIVRIIASQGSH